MRWELIEATGWTLEYVDSLPLAAYWEWVAVKGGRNQGQAWNQRRTKTHKGK